MESMNKFKILTVVIVCMFLFVIAAIYSNTKDVATSKTQPDKTLSTDYKQKTESVKNDASVEYLEQQVEFLNKRIDELSEKTSAVSDGMSCKIIGVSTPDGIERLSQDAAIDEARNSGSELVITCSF